MWSVALPVLLAMLAGASIVVQRALNANLRTDPSLGRLVGLHELFRGSRLHGTPGAGDA